MAKKLVLHGKTSAAEFAALISTAYGPGLIGLGSRSALQMKRVSSGILALDEALGGGWPFGKVGILAGEYSTGKSAIALQACASVENYDHRTKVHRLLLKPEELDRFEKGRALYVDVENTFDVKWAKAHGFDDTHHYVAQPSSSEQTIDIISRAIEEDVFDLIILDSIAQMTPDKEIEVSSEEWQMGLAARLNNKAFRKWNANLAKTVQAGVPGPFLLAINQMRVNIGTMFGDPRILPGGKGQTFAASVMVYTKSTAYDNKEASTMSSAELSGLVYKNKTYKPKQNYSFKLGLVKTPELDCGEINNTEQLIKRGKAFKFITKSGGSLVFAGNSFGSEAALAAGLAAHEALRLKLWRSILTASVGSV